MAPWGERALHKPLMVLWALARCQRGLPRLASFEEVDEGVGDLLAKYGNRSSQIHPEYPFWRLQNDGGIWTVSSKLEIAPNAAGDVAKRVLVEARAAGGFSEACYAALRRDPDLLRRKVQEILDEYFEPGIHPDLIADLAIDMGSAGESPRRRRSPTFVDDVIRAYEWCCAVCGYGGRIRDRLVAVEAAHIKWHCYNGPDVPQNGLALCSIHHKAFDRGIIGLDVTDGTRSNGGTIAVPVILISQYLNGPGPIDDLFLRYHKQPIRRPQDPAKLPSAEFVAWHAKEVFCGPGRV